MKKVRCPIPSTHDKFEEAHYFLHRMIEAYHFPNEFRWNLNAFIQALRNITWILQKETSKVPKFEESYERKREEMKRDALWLKFKDGRNIIVKERMLIPLSKASVGLFSGREVKLAFDVNVSPFTPSKVVFETAKKELTGFLIDKKHSEPGEQLGIERTWIVSEISDNEIVEECYESLSKMEELLREAHKFFGRRSKQELRCVDHLDRVLLETDFDPTLTKKWKWD